ncbi:MAG: hypothetical protein ACK5YK_00475 [Pseudomonadota bacterium]
MTDLNALAAKVALALNGRTDEAFVQGVMTAYCKEVGLGWDSLPSWPGVVYAVCVFKPDVPGWVGVLFIDEDGNVFIEGEMPAETLLAARYARLLAARLLKQATEREEFLHRSAVKGTLPFGVFFSQAVTLAAHVGRYNGLTGAEAVAAFLSDHEGVALH